MDTIFKEDVEEIIKILRKKNKKDLITKIRIHFEELLDEDYKPPKKIRRERYSDDEGSADEEDYDVCVCSDGFWSIS